MNKPKLSWAETNSLDVSACYQQGKVARQKNESRFQNPYSNEKFVFEKYWDQGWVDEDDLINK
jgi:hypothetical protein